MKLGKGKLSQLKSLWEALELAILDDMKKSCRNDYQEDAAQFENRIQHYFKTTESELSLKQLKELGKSLKKLIVHDLIFDNQVQYPPKSPLSNFILTFVDTTIISKACIQELLGDDILLMHSFCLSNILDNVVRAAATKDVEDTINVDFDSVRTVSQDENPFEIF